MFFMATIVVEIFLLKKYKNIDFKVTHEEEQHACCSQTPSDVLVR